MSLSLAALLIGILAGALGALLGLGGGVIVVPMLSWASEALGAKLSLQQTVAISQVGVLAVGVSAAASHLASGLVKTDFAYRMVPLVVLGGVAGSLLGLVLPEKAVAVVFSLLLLYSAYKLMKSKTSDAQERPASKLLKPAMCGAGVASGLLGVGGGTVQVPVLNLLGGLPLREAIATSTFVMGFTAAANILVYGGAGKLDLQLACATSFGVLCGAALGARLQRRVAAERLRQMFVLLLVFAALQMLYKHIF